MEMKRTSRGRRPLDVEAQGVVGKQARSLSTGTDEGQGRRAYAMRWSTAAPYLFLHNWMHITSNYT